MKSAPAALVALINTGDYVDFDVYTINLAGGALTLRYTTANFNITDGFHTWYSNGVRISKDGTTGQAHWKTGLDVDTWQVIFVPRPFDQVTGAAFPDKIGNVPWLEAVESGALDYAEVEIGRAYFATVPTYPLPAGGAAPMVGTSLVIFAGVVAEVDTTHMIAAVTIRDYRTLLTAQSPPHVFQAACRHTLFDVGCTLNPATFAVTSRFISAGSTKNQIIATSLFPPGGSGTYKLGRLVMTSGKNDSFARTISDWDGNFQLTLVNPLPFDPGVGDSFTIYPGCDKSFATCGAFGNSLNFGGFEFVPTPETAI
jgi:uncharacterized phage protein (TIGR02218 family)